MAGDAPTTPMFDWEAEARQNAERLADAEMYARHEEWLRTSWGGWAVRLMRNLADNSFTHAVMDAINSEENDMTSLAVKNGARLAVIVGMILFTLAVGKLLSFLVGTDIVIEQEVIVEEEVRRGDLDDDASVDEKVVHEEEANKGAGAAAAQTVTRRSARTKKDK